MEDFITEDAEIWEIAAAVIGMWFQVCKFSAFWNSKDGTCMLQFK